MVSTYSPSLRLELMATGDQSGTWGDTTNTNLGTLLEQAITGVLSKPMADADQVLTMVNGGSDESRNAVVTVTGALTAARTVTVPDENKLYLFRNETTGGFAVTIKTAAGTGVSVPFGTARWVYCDGTNVVDGLGGAQGYSYTGNFQFLGDRAFSLLDETGSGLVFGSPNPVPKSVALRLLGANVLSIGSGTASVVASMMVVESTNPGPDGPFLDLYHNSASPAVSDIVGAFRGLGENASGGQVSYGRMAVTIQDTTAGSEDGRIHLQPMVNGTTSDVLIIDGTQVRSLVPLVAPGMTLTSSTIARSVGDSNVTVSGGSSGSLGANLELYGEVHASQANNAFMDADQFTIRSQAGVYRARFNAGSLLIGTEIAINPNVNLNDGINLTLAGQVVASNTSQLAATFRRQGTDGRVVNFYKNTGNVGGIDVTGAGTAYVTTSDESWKDFIGLYDPMRAVDIIRRDPVRDFRWKSDGSYAVGWGAQTSYEVSHDLASPGGWFDPHSGEPVEPRSHRWADPITHETVEEGFGRWVDPVTEQDWVEGGVRFVDHDGEPLTELVEGAKIIRAQYIQAECVDAEYRPWGVDQAKRTPYLWAAVAWLLDERDEMLERIERLEARLGIV